MSKEIDKITCTYCESTYKLSYSLDETSGFPKFCPFCANENYEEAMPDFEGEDE